MFNNVKVIISDLDGTLLNKNHRLDPYTIEVIKELSQTDIKFWIATGRHHCDATNIRKELGVEAVVISSNGATVAGEDGELIDQAFITREVVESILAMDFPEGVYQNLYQGALWLMQEPDQVFSSYYQPDDFKYTLCRFSDHFDQPINKVFFTSFDNAKLRPIAEKVQQLHGDHVEVTFSMNECLEIMPKNVNKGTAIEKTLARYGFDSSQAIAFGDGLNDLEMLKIVGKGFVMGNAHPLLKENLPNHDYIGDNDENSVAEMIEAIIRHRRNMSA